MLGSVELDGGIANDGEADKIMLVRARLGFWC